MPGMLKRIARGICRAAGMGEAPGPVRAVRYEVALSDQLRGRRAIITGGGSGIGLAMARKFAACGATVLVAGRRARRLEEACAGDAAGRMRSMAWDVSDFPSVEKKIDEAFGLLGGAADILVNNAGVSEREEFGALTERVWDRLMEVNLKAPVFIAQSVARRWKDAGARGTILNVSSMAGEEPAFDAYGASKCALTSMTRGMARALAPYGIRVCGIAPGVTIGTDLREFQRSIKPDGDIKCAWIPAGRYAVPEEIAEIAAFAVSDRAAYMNGHVFVCDGAGALRR